MFQIVVQRWFTENSLCMSSHLIWTKIKVSIVIIADLLSLLLVRLMKWKNIKINYLKVRYSKKSDNSLKYEKPYSISLVEAIEQFILKLFVMWSYQLLTLEKLLFSRSLKENISWLLSFPGVLHYIVYFS